MLAIVSRRVMVGYLCLLIQDALKMTTAQPKSNSTAHILYPTHTAHCTLFPTTVHYRTQQTRLLYAAVLGNCADYYYCHHVQCVQCLLCLLADLVVVSGIAPTKN